jgi:hypothetical protein
MVSSTRFSALAVILSAAKDPEGVYTPSRAFRLFPTRLSTVVAFSYNSPNESSFQPKLLTLL